MATAIKVENVSKIYRLGEIGTGTISKDLERFFKMKILKQKDPFLRIGEANDRATKGASDIVYSLNDINFEIEQGNAVGIIGRNGAGKSTLLKILSRVTSPTAGKINIKGRVASLLEVGTGFHPELTGRENIYLNGAILGMRKKEIDRKFDEIVDFSGVERYIDTPVKRYSSGMYVRLAFAVAAHLESEILIVDEVLAVGDAEFQNKCLGKMESVSKNEGRTILFVSHNLAAVQKFCKSCMVLNKGQIEHFSNDIITGTKNYLNINSNLSSITTIYYNNINQHHENFTLIKFYLGDQNNESIYNPQLNDSVKYLYVSFLIDIIDSALEVGYHIFNSNNELVYISQHNDSGNSKAPILKTGENTLRTPIPIRLLNEDVYRIQLAVSLYRRAFIYDPNLSEATINLEISGGMSESPYWIQKRHGHITPVINWEEV
jgi:lipopolysaccharide transport system ATP-binding protein